MKKIYLLSFALLAFVFSSNAQIIEDDFEFYTLGDMADQNPSVWNNWSNDPLGAPAENIIVSDDFANSGTKSGLIADGGVQDAMLLLGDHTSGIRTLNFMFYVPSGRTGYYNFQESVPAGANWALHVHFNETGATNGVGGFASDNSATPVAGVTFTYPEDTWFLMSHEIDMDNNTVIVRVDGTEAYNGDFFAETGQVSGVDMFSISGNNTYYVDDVLYVDGTLGTDDFSSDVFSVYPNPVKNVLNISSKNAVNSITVYDILGKVVLKANPDAISPSIDMSGLSSGAYLVNVTIGNSSKTVKVIK